MYVTDDINLPSMTMALIHGSHTMFYINSVDAAWRKKSKSFASTLSDLLQFTRQLAQKIYVESNCLTPTHSQDTSQRFTNMTLPRYAAITQPVSRSYRRISANIPAFGSLFRTMTRFTNIGGFRITRSSF